MAPGSPTGCSNLSGSPPCRPRPLSRCPRCSPSSAPGRRRPGDEVKKTQHTTHKRGSVRRERGARPGSWGLVFRWAGRFRLGCSPRSPSQAQWSASSRRTAASSRTSQSSVQRRRECPNDALENLFLSFSEKSIRRTPRCELMFFFFFSKAMRTSRGKCGCWRPLASASLAAPLPPISSALVKRYTTHKSEEFLVLYIFSTII